MHIPTCTLASAVKTGCTWPCWTHSKPLNVRAKEKIFLKTSRQVKPSTDMSPVLCQSWESQVVMGYRLTMRINDVECTRDSTADHACHLEREKEVRPEPSVFVWVTGCEAESVQACASQHKLWEYKEHAFMCSLVFAEVLPLNEVNELTEFRLVDTVIEACEKPSRPI